MKDERINTTGFMQGFIFLMLGFGLRSLGAVLATKELTTRTVTFPFSPNELNSNQVPITEMASRAIAFQITTEVGIVFVIIGVLLIAITFWFRLSEKLTMPSQKF